MASPGGYPQMQQNPMMGGGMHNNMMPPPRGPAKRGVSKAVPVVVSAGLAVGVFCGLLFGLGTGDPSASAGPAKGNNLKAMGSGSDAAPVPDKGAGPAGLGATAAAPPPKPTGSGAGSATGSGAGSSAGSGAAIASATGSAAGSNAGSAAAKAPDVAKLTIEVEPAAAASVAKIQIDGKDVDGTTIDVPADKKSVKVSVTAAGFHSIENKKVDVTAGAETKVEIELTKRSSGGSPGFGGASTGGNHVPTAPPRKKPSNNGIIDI